jgi:hypothetical protein
MGLIIVTLIPYYPLSRLTSERVGDIMRLRGSSSEIYGSVSSSIASYPGAWQAASFVSLALAGILRTFFFGLMVIVISITVLRIPFCLWIVV